MTWSNLKDIKADHEIGSSPVAEIKGNFNEALLGRVDGMHLLGRLAPTRLLFRDFK